MSVHEQAAREREALHRRWVQRLYADYAQVCFSYRRDLVRPVIRIAPLPSHWGKWDPMTRTLTIATQLIEGYPWDVVVEILKHEMAHQMTDEELGGDDGHGPCFQEACRLLGVAAWAARAEADLASPIAPWVKPPADSQEDRLLRRVEKLLALATSSNEHEALLAMQKVQELYARYNLDRLERRRDDDHVCHVIHTGRRRLGRHQYLICSILNDHFFVQVVHGSLFDAARLSEYRSIELLGTRENVLMAEYVYHFLANQTEMLWNGYRRENRGRLRSAYFLGVLSGFRDKLEDSRQEGLRRAAREGGENPFALTAREDRRLEKFVETRYPRLRNVRGGRTLRDGISFEAGRAEGKNLVLRRGIETRGNGGGRLLPSR